MLVPSEVSKQACRFTRELLRVCPFYHPGSAANNLWVGNDRGRTRRLDTSPNPPVRHRCLGYFLSRPTLVPEIGENPVQADIATWQTGCFADFPLAYHSDRRSPWRVYFSVLRMHELRPPLFSVGAPLAEAPVWQVRRCIPYPHPICFTINSCDGRARAHPVLKP